jgi:phosphoribosylglycinamide formyltransferase-1
VPVRAGDTEEALAARVLEQEHVVYPRAIRWFLEGRLQRQGERVTLAGERETSAALRVPDPAA